MIALGVDGHTHTHTHKHTHAQIHTHTHTHTHTHPHRMNFKKPGVPAFAFGQCKPGLQITAH